ncbi:hypothetical protein ACA910_004992 [Epithemia clementina (nom. ined.)]
MGDCRLLFRVDSSLCNNTIVVASGKGGTRSEEERANNDRGLPPPPIIPVKTVCFSKVFSADTTIREAMDETTFRDVKELEQHQADPSRYPRDTSLRSLMRGEKRARLWDCTRHPPCDITDWPLHTFSAVKGSKSKTLYDAGWYPSGTLVLLPPNETPKVSSYLNDDIQFNAPPPPRLDDGASNKKSKPQSHHAQKQQQQQQQKPSQVLQAAKNRFPTEADSNCESSAALEQSAKKLRHQQSEQRRQQEANRKNRLEQCLRKLDHQIIAKKDSNNNNNNNKNASISAQVRRMLVKSRATGRAGLAMQDRVYIQFIFLVDDEDKEEQSVVTTAGSSKSTNSTTTASQEEPGREEYCYFSRQDTVGRVLDSFPIPPSRQMEFIVKTTMIKNNSAAKSNGWINTAADSSEDYRKLPSLMRLYEAVDSGYMSEADNQVILRIFDATKQEHTPVVERLHTTHSDPSVLQDPPDSRNNNHNNNDDAADPLSDACCLHPSQSSDSMMMRKLEPSFSEDPPGVAASLENNDPTMESAMPPQAHGAAVAFEEKSCLYTAPSSDTVVESFRTMTSDPCGSKSEDDDAAFVEPSSRSPTVLNPRLVQAIRTAEQQQQQHQNGTKRKSKSSKATTAAAIKVHQMQIKSKAVGDEKRVRPLDRMYFPVFVVLIDPESSLYAVHSFRHHFLATTDQLNRLVRDYYTPYSYDTTEDGTSYKVQEWDYLILPAASTTTTAPATIESDAITLQRVLDPSQSLQELKGRALLQSFDIVVLVPVA